MKVLFTKTAQKQLNDWLTSNMSVVNKIDELIADIQENGFLIGTGKPEQLKRFKNPPRYSRRITKSDRLVYAPVEDDLVILSCKGHYDDK